MTAIWWIRRDLRLSDNLALQAALRHCQVIPVFILDPHLLARTPIRRQNFLYNSLQSLDQGLRLRGSRLVLRAGNPLDTLQSLLIETGAEAIYSEEDYTPYSHRRDGNIASRFPLHLIHGQTVHHPAGILNAGGKPYTVFSPFSRTWKALLPVELMLVSAPERLDPPPSASSLDIPIFPRDEGFPASEFEAHRRLRAFLEGPISDYSERRNRVDLDGTSALSPYIRFGILSTRQAVAGALTFMQKTRDKTSRQSAENWLNEIIWREFYISILYHFPGVMRQSFRADLQHIRWQNDPDDFLAWKEGRTGYPVVDAAMRQLSLTGWMHNRARMIVASFLVKDLLIDWRWGERWFMENLLDGDPAANNGGWQWTAGTGTDAAPYFRIFNPVLQGQKFDPEGGFIRRWLPKLARLPAEHIHAPWEMPLKLQMDLGCVIGQDYPAPIIDHRLARQRALAVYQQAGR